MIKQENVIIRLMGSDDMEGVMEVERDAFSTPWDQAVFETELDSNRFAHYLVYEYNGRIIGYCGVWVVMDEAQITNIAIHSDFRGQGHGKELLRSVIVFLKKFSVINLSLEVRITNKVAQHVYRKFGFKMGNIRKEYYADNLEDALVMWVNLNETK